MSCLLTPAERARFISWLDVRAQSGEGVLAQMVKANVPEPVRRMVSVENMACRVVERILRSIADQSISSLDIREAFDGEVGS